MQREGHVRRIEERHGNADEREKDNAEHTKRLAELEEELTALAEHTRRETKALEDERLRLSAANVRINKRARAAEAKTNRAKLAIICATKALGPIDDLTRSDLLDDAQTALTGTVDAVREVLARHVPPPDDGTKRERKRNRVQGNVVAFPRGGGPDV